MRKLRTWRAVHRRQRPLLGIGVANLGESDSLTVRPPERDLGLAQRESVAGVAEHADRLLGAGDLGAAAGGVDVDLAKLVVDLRRGDPLRLHLGRIENDPDLAVDAARAPDLGHALTPSRRLATVLSTYQLNSSSVMSVASAEKIGERSAGEIDAVDLRLEDAVGKVASNLVDRVADVVDRRGRPEFRSRTGRRWRRSPR